jgi:hypothetical protein
MDKRRTTTSEWACLRKEILARDEERCQKCGRAAYLEVHHIKPVRDGGPDISENLCTLCNPCHEEWGAVECWIGGTGKTFADWLAAPPMFLFLMFYWQRDSNKKLGHMTASRFLNEMGSARQNMIGLGWGGPDEG